MTIGVAPMLVSMALSYTAGMDHPSPLQRDSEPPPRWSFARVAALLAALLGAAVLLGWTLSIPTLTRVLPWMVPMRPQTAANFVLGGIGLWLATRSLERTAWRRMAVAAALSVGVIALLSILEHALGVDVDVRRLLLGTPASTLAPLVSRRMSLNAAIAFLLLSLALLAKLRGTPRSRALSDGLSVGALLIALVALAGHTYGRFSVLTGFAPYLRLPAHAAAGLVALAAGLLAARPAGPIAATLSSTGVGGMLVRRLIPTVSVLLLATGWLSLVGAQHGYYGIEVGLANLIVISIIVLAAAIGLIAIAVEKTETERTRAEFARRESEHRYHSIAESTFDGIVISENGLIREVNPGLSTMFGYDSRELQGRQLAELVTDEWRAIVRERVLLGSEGIFEAIGLRRDGEKFPLEIFAKSGGEGGNLRISAVRDVTERRKLEDQLRQAMKLEAVGRLASGVAHDFNNLLTVIQGHAEMLREAAHLDEPGLADVRQILNASASAAALTRQLLAFSRKQDMKPTVLALNTTVTKAAAFLTRLIGEGITIRTVLAEDLLPIKADPAQLEQVIVNLALNGRDAMPVGGTLTIETSAVEIDFATAHIGMTPGHYVMLAVSDTGLGMDECTQRQIFEPFFTTKELGRGTGLGLATVYGIVKQSGGSIGVYSELGRGTRFKIYFPSTDQPVEDERTTIPIAPQPRGTETVLLAEDSEAVRMIARETLERWGYTVLEAADAGSAIRLAAEYSGQIHLLVTDVVMPGASGAKLAEDLVREWPDLRLLFISGYTSNALVAHGIFRPGFHLLEKPFSPADLALRVRQVLDIPAPSPIEIAS